MSETLKKSETEEYQESSPLSQLEFMSYIKSRLR